ncbi:hypothetical protein [Sporosarcina sp. D27]|uniref:hypothetical protein n=1 Tax=Sporosarcina sp. D27 TaxID=1382305 RepID=UPI000470512E|nr:hypothetical protein [Sporosarcina sp. D27]
MILIKKESEGVNDKKEIVKHQNENPSFSSPTSVGSEEETRILTDYIGQKNMFKIAGFHEPLRKTLTLKKFLKSKRNQQVVINSFVENDQTFRTEGKVAAIGRDFVMLTDLQRRIWIPYVFIETANIPFGFPTYSNPHQHHIYDNQLQRKLMLKFGETVMKREALVQQFFEESLRTNMNSWEGTWVEIVTGQERFVGSIVKTTKNHLLLKRFSTSISIRLETIQYVSTLRVFPLFKKIVCITFYDLYKKVKGGRKDGY